MKKVEQDKYQTIILAVAHNEFLEWDAEGVHQLGAKQHVLYDIKSVFPIDDVDARL